MQNFSNAKNGGVGKMCIFQQQTVHISKIVRDTAKVTIHH